MTIAGHFAAIAEGRLPDDAGLLHTCRLEWQGSEAYGEEAILELFRGAPFAMEGAKLLETPNSAVLIGDDRALWADIYNGRLGRLWRIGGEARRIAEPAISVAFDPDLQQARRDVFLSPDDHPELAAGDLERVAEAGHKLCALPQTPPDHRVRAFVIRAFSAQAGSAALFALYRLTGGQVRRSTWSHAAVLLDAPAIIDPISTAQMLSHL